MSGTGFNLRQAEVNTNGVMQARQSMVRDRWRSDPGEQSKGESEEAGWNRGRVTGQRGRLGLGEGAGGSGTE